MQAAQPGNAAFDAHAEAGVGNGAVAAEIEIPPEGVEWQAVRANLVLQHRRVVLALAAPDDLAVSLGGEDVDAERAAGIRGVGLHVERLRLDRIAVYHDGPVEALGERGLLV